MSSTVRFDMVAPKLVPGDVDDDCLKTSCPFPGESNHRTESSKSFHTSYPKVWTI